MYKNNDSNTFLKTGFSKVIKPFENSMADVEKISKALGIGIKVYHNKTRKYQFDKIEPHINHSLRVALILSDEIKMNDSDIVCSSILHDIFGWEEITSETKELIKKEIGEKVWNTIAFFNIKSNKDNSDKGEKQTVDKQISKIKKSDYSTKCIILAERLDDLRSLKSSRRKDKITRIKEETEKYYIPLAESTNEKILLKLIIALYELK